MAFGVQSFDHQTFKNNSKVIVSSLWAKVCNLTFAKGALNDTDFKIYMVAAK